jgi:uncharacterized protein YraI
MTYYHGAALVTRIKGDRGKAIYSSMCQAYCVTRAGTGAVGDYDGDGAADAQDGWRKAKGKGKVVLAADIKSYSDIPAGTFAYWEGGSHGYGHVAITIGGGQVQSTDAPTWGRIGVVDIGWIASHWGNGLKFVGYVVIDGNGHRMVDAAAPSYTVTRENAEYVVEVVELNGRSGPGTSYPINKTAAKGAKITSVGRTKIGETTWVKNVEGLWWHRGYLNPRRYPAVADDTVYVVTADPSLAGRTYPVRGDVVVQPKKGAIVTAAARTEEPQDDGEFWVKNIAGSWFSTKYLEASNQAPTPAPTPARAHLRMGHYNLPGPDKHANADARAKRAAALVQANQLDVLTTNELVGTGVDSTTSAGSSFARTLHGYLGTTEWGMVVPTTAYNENYIFYRKAKMALVQGFADKKIYAAGVPGRHVTRVALRDLETGKELALGATHLVNNNEPGAALQAPLVWDAMAAVKGDRPVFIAGDMNTDKTLTGFTNPGLRNARLTAKASTNAKASTYVGWSDTTPDYDPNWIIDQFYVDPEFDVDGYTVVLDTKADGTFNTPKPSDHLLVVIAVTEK